MGVGVCTCIRACASVQVEGLNRHKWSIMQSQVQLLITSRSVETYVRIFHYVDR